MTDPEADVMGGLQFAARNVSRIGIEAKEQDLKSGLIFNVSVHNPYAESLAGEASWLMDASAFAIEPERIALQIPGGATREYSFNLKTLRETTTLQSLPQLEFNIASGGRRHRFHPEVRFLRATQTPYRGTAPVIDGALRDWEGVPVLKLADRGRAPAELRSCYDSQALYIACCVPTMQDDEAKESGFSDELQIGIAQRLSETDFGGDLLRLGLNPGLTEPKDRTPGHNPTASITGSKSMSCHRGKQTCYEIAVPLRLLKSLKPRPGGRMILDLSFPVPDLEPEERTAEPETNTFSYRVRYGSDSLVPVYYVELNLEHIR